MAYLYLSKHSPFEECYATIDEKTGVASVWIRLGVGVVAFDVAEIDGLINALSDALTAARALEAKAKS